MEQNLYTILESKGYDSESAIKCVNDVLDARKILRELELKNYVGKRVKGEFDGLTFDVLVHDVKINQDGKAEFQVKPLNGGNKMAWIKKINQ